MITAFDFQSKKIILYCIKTHFPLAFKHQKTCSIFSFYHSQHIKDVTKLAHRTIPITKTVSVR